MNLTTATVWLGANWELVLAVVVGAIANLSQRPHPEQLTGIQRIFWLVIDRLCFMTTTKYPQLKWFLAPSPLPAPKSDDISRPADAVTIIPVQTPPTPVILPPIPPEDPKP